MRVRPWQVALAGGVVSSGVLCAFLVLEKKRKLEARGKALERSMMTGEGRSALADQARGIQDRLERFAGTYTESLAKRAADAHLAQHYGLTPERMQNVDRLIGAFETLGR